MRNRKDYFLLRCTSFLTNPVRPCYVLPLICCNYTINIDVCSSGGMCCLIAMGGWCYSWWNSLHNCHGHESSAALTNPASLWTIKPLSDSWSNYSNWWEHHQLDFDNDGSQRDKLLWWSGASLWWRWSSAFFACNEQCWHFDQHWWNLIHAS